jgi:23S rRNA (adenine2030-N6)-methyltransferase
MLAYRHAFHAGNHADVLKHVVLVLLLRYMNLKDKGYRVVDTHAGAGLYALESPQAQKNAEYLQGIGRLWARADLPEAVADYRQLVARVNADGELRHYPGSPTLARALLRPQDQLCLFELHPSDFRELQALFGPSKGVEIRPADGFAALKSQLPPPTRRSLVLVDPSYEGVGDYRRVLDMLADALRRFAQGVYMVWYPVVAKPGAAAMVQRLKSVAPKGWLHARLSVQPTDARGYGLAGSGIFVLNPPHTLHAQLQALLPWLAQALAQHDGAEHLLQQHAP